MIAASTTTGVVCSLCGWTAERFLPQGRIPRPNALCGGCSSLERHRAIYLYLRDQTTVFNEPTRLLHFAPERALRAAIERGEEVDYVTTDLEMRDVSMRMDIEDLAFKDQVFDFVICSHVLEHIEDDRAALREIRRVLRPDGVALILVPMFDPPRQPTFEDPSITDPAARELAFGQRDHFRMYGDDFPDRVRECGFEVEIVTPGRDFSSDEAARLGVIRDEQLFACRPSKASEASRPASSSAAMAVEGPVGFKTNISPSDPTARADALGHYFGVGLEALRIIEDALAAAGLPDPDRILDFPSGHGRVLRMLRFRFPNAHITARDTDAAGVEFCASEFGAEPSVAPASLSELSLNDSFDLIWCGSLFARTPPDACVDLLTALARHLKAPGGLLVFTMHGDAIARLIESGGMTVAVDDGEVQDLLLRYRRDGHGFKAYAHSSSGGDGVALTSKAWIEEQVERVPGLHELSHAEAAWDGRQDVMACQSALG